MGFIATTFAGNVPYFDILATTEDHRAVHVQVKAINTGDWQPHADQYLDIRFHEDGKQEPLGIKKLPETVCVFVQLRKLGEDDFYIFWMKDLQRIMFDRYKASMDRLGGYRKNNPKSTHMKITVDDIKGYKDNWELLEDLLNPPASS